MDRAFTRENTRRLELARQAGREIFSREEWLRQGRQPRPGQRRKCMRIYIGKRPVKHRKTGQKIMVPAWAHVFGFTPEQVF